MARHRSTPTPDVPPDPVSRIVRTNPVAPQPATPPAEIPPAPANLLNIGLLLCPSCRSRLSTYGTAQRGEVTVRYHQCRHCGATAIRTHQMPDGRILFIGWAGRSLPEFSRN